MGFVFLVRGYLLIGILVMSMRFWRKFVMTCMACGILEGIRWMLYYKFDLVT
jgi:hypothetical protein